LISLFSIFATLPECASSFEANAAIGFLGVSVFYPALRGFHNAIDRADKIRDDKMSDGARIVQRQMFSVAGRRASY
jgi:hypothetical protein